MVKKGFPWAVACLLCLCACRPEVEVYDLTCEGLAEPLAIDSPQPHFSWKIRPVHPAARRTGPDTTFSAGTLAAQAAWQIQVVPLRAGFPKGRNAAARLFRSCPLLWDSGRIGSADQVMVSYAGEALHGRQLAAWRVRIWDTGGKASRWSRPQRFGIGALTSLQGEYIGAVPGEGRAPLLRKRFSCEGKVRTALLHVNSLGYHEAYLNGRSVSDGVLSPAVSQLDKRSLIVTYDVTPLLRRGDNELVLWAGSGWYKPDTFGAAYEGPLVKAELDVFPDSSTRPEPEVLVCTDGSWEGAWSGYRDLGTWKWSRFGGEAIDARVVPAGLLARDLEGLDWSPVDVVPAGGIVAAPQMCEPCRVQETVGPVSIAPDGEGRWIVDFGRVLNGMLELRLPPLPAGHRTRVSYSDHRTADGRMEFYSHDEYLSSGSPEGDRFANRFNHHVFRYVMLDSLPQAPSLKDMKARRMRTDFVRTGRFHSSDEELNRIHDLVAYTLENLAFDGYMVDCANIERLGYGGDGNASTLTLQELGAVAPLYLNWLQAWIDAQAEDGSLPHTAPCPYKAGGGPYWCSFIVQAPWRTWMSYGDPRLPERCYPAMLGWISYVDAYTVDGLLKRWPDLENRNWYLGDWAAPPERVDVLDPASVDLVNNCALCQAYQQLEQIATLLGRPADAAQFRQRNAALGERIHAVFYHPEDASYGSGSQIDLAYPLLVGLVPDSLRTQVRDCLVRRTEEVYGGHLVTGLVGVPVVTEWATLSGECDWMYGMLKQHAYPGYLYMLDNGATGTWEHWDAERSRMHNCFNGIGSWFYQALGGILPLEPGYRRIRIAPQVPEGLEWVHVSQQTPYGPVSVRREGRSLHFEIPAGVTALVRGREYGCGAYDLEL